MVTQFESPTPNYFKPIKRIFNEDDHATFLLIKQEKAGFGDHYRANIRKLWLRFPGEILMHLEWTAGNAKIEGHVHRPASAGKALVGGIPLIRFKSEERLQEILDYCAEIGVFIANPPTYYL